MPELNVPTHIKGPCKASVKSMAVRITSGTSVSGTCTTKGQTTKLKSFEAHIAAKVHEGYQSNAGHCGEANLEKVSNKTWVAKTTVLEATELQTKCDQAPPETKCQKSR